MRPTSQGGVEMFSTVPGHWVLNVAAIRFPPEICLLTEAFLWNALQLGARPCWPPISFFIIMRDHPVGNVISQTQMPLLHFVSLS